MSRSFVGVFLAFSLLANGFCLPHLRLRRQTDNNRDAKANEQFLTVSSVVESPLLTLKSASLSKSDSTKSPAFVASTNNLDLPPPVPYNDDDDDDGFDTPTQYSSGGGGGGSNVFSLLNLVSGLSSGSSSSGKAMQKLLKEIMKRYKPKIILRRQDLDNEIDFEYIDGLKPPPLQKQENNESDDNSDESNGNGESLENDERNNSEEDSDSNLDDDDIDDDDYDEPPGGGDGEGGGLLGLLAGLSGGEDGQSDLGSLLATISGIVVNLSGDGIDLNALIASGIGLFVGLLSEGEENPGAIIASYLLTSLDTITGGGAKNNGAFFGKFLSKLIKGTSAGSSRSTDEGSSPLWNLSLDIFRALLQFGTTIIGMASSSVFSSSSS